MNTNVNVIGLTRLGIKSTSTAPEADALTTRPLELLHSTDMATTAAAVEIRVCCILASIYFSPFIYQTFEILSRDNRCEVSHENKT